MQQSSHLDKTSRGFMKKTRPIIATVLAGLTIAFLLSLNFKRDTVFTGFIQTMAQCIGLPLFLLAIFFLWKAKKKPEDVFNNIGIILMVVGGVLLLQWLVIPMGKQVSNYQIQKTQAYCESLIPLIEEYKQVNGEYPETLDDFLPPETKLPSLLQSRSFYVKTGDAFNFAFIEPDSFINRTYIYDSTTKLWQVYD